MKRSKQQTKVVAPKCTPISAKYAKIDKLKTADGDANSSTIGEVGGREGPDPTRYGDWEKNGRCVDF